MNTDLISRKDLQIEITQQIAYFHDRANTTSIYDDKLAYNLKATGLEHARILIDNAPTVDLVSPIIKVNIPEETKQELIEELQKPHKLLVLPESEVEYPFYQEAYQTGYEEGRKDFERPKGKWIDRMADKGYVECPFCHKQITGGDLNFCVKCGADMRGEEKETKNED